MNRWRMPLAIGAILLFTHPFSVNANTRPLPVEPLSKQDFDKVPAGAAVWFHKKGKVWFHLVIGGHGYMQIDRRLWKFVRTKPTGATWGCMAMDFKRPSGPGAVRIYKKAPGWTVKFTIGTQTSEIRGLVCASGD